MNKTAPADYQAACAAFTKIHQQIIQHNSKPNATSSQDQNKVSDMVNIISAYS